MKEEEDKLNIIIDELIKKNDEFYVPSKETQVKLIINIKKYNNYNIL